MIILPASVRILLCLEPTDMRRSFDGLSMMTETILKQNPLSGHLFVFRNKRKDRIKILYWNHDGFAIWYKRLEEGTYQFPKTASDNISLEIEARDLFVMLDGIDLSKVKRLKRYSRKTADFFT